MFKLETHCHTSEVSGCSRLPAVQLVTQLKRSGYGGAVITDHFHHGYFDSLTGSWTQKIDCFLSGYRAACEAGAQAGLHIYCGLEFRTTTSDNDYLLFGAAPELLYSTPELHRYTIPQLRALGPRRPAAGAGTPVSHRADAGGPRPVGRRGGVQRQRPS